MELRFDVPTCGQHISSLPPPSGITHRAQIAVLQSPFRASYFTSITPAFAACRRCEPRSVTEPSVRTCGPSCAHQRKTFRMSAPVRFVNWIHSSHSLRFGMLACFYFFITALRAHRPLCRARAISRAPYRQARTRAHYAELSLVSPVRNAELVSLSPPQQSAFHDAQLSASAQESLEQVPPLLLAGGFSLCSLFSRRFRWS